MVDPQSPLKPKQRSLYSLDGVRYLQLCHWTLSNFFGFSFGTNSVTRGLEIEHHFDPGRPHC